MNQPNPNLRKAAVIIRSLDAETAATMLAQLSPAEAASLRAAIRALGAMDPEEQADVAAEFRRARPLATEPAGSGVQLDLSSLEAVERHSTNSTNQSTSTGAKRFDFLEQAPIDVLVSYLAREHVQTIAVVLSHLRAERAAAVLGALPEKTQADVVERLSALGATDPESVVVLEHELAAWLASRVNGPRGGARRNEMVASILAAADSSARENIFANLRTHKALLAEELAPCERRPQGMAMDSGRKAMEFTRRRQSPAADQVASLAPPAPLPAAVYDVELRIEFDQLIHVDRATLAAVLRDVNPNVLALALAGSREELLDRVCEQMPKRTARSFRRQLRQLGPTRLSDVEAAQHLVANMTAQRLAKRRRSAVPVD